MRVDVRYPRAAYAISTEKRRYERPGLVRHQSGLMNKFGRIRAMRPHTRFECDKVLRFSVP